MFDAPVEFRPATSVDVEVVVALVERAYRGEPSRAGWTTEADLLGGQRTDRQEIAQLLADPKARILLCLRATRLVGCVLARLDEGEGYIGMLAVQPTEQGSGLGRRLLAEAEETLRRTFGATRVHMTVIQQREELIAYYERRGYRRTGKTEPFPYGDPRFGAPLRPDLQFLVLEKSLR
jgi:ribosomal protein S18 acetylase RimI-like enzyme